MQFPLQIDATTPGAFLHGMQEPDWFACTLWWPTEPLSGSGFVVKTKVVRLFPGFVFLPGSWCSLCSFSFRDLHATTRDVLGLFVLFCHKNYQIVEQLLIAQVGTSCNFFVHQNCFYLPNTPFWGWFDVIIIDSHFFGNELKKYKYQKYLTGLKLILTAFMCLTATT